MTQTNPSSPLTGVEPALRRAAARARQIAQQTHTPLVVFKDGRIERQLPDDQARQSSERKVD